MRVGLPPARPTFPLPVASGAVLEVWEVGELGVR